MSFNREAFSIKMFEWNGQGTISKEKMCRLRNNRSDINAGNAMSIYVLMIVSSLITPKWTINFSRFEILF